MRVKLHHLFEKSYKARIASSKKLISQTEERIALFKSGPKNSLLKDHGLTGAKKASCIFYYGRYPYSLSSSFRYGSCIY